MCTITACSPWLEKMARLWEVTSWEEKCSPLWNLFSAHSRALPLHENWTLTRVIANWWFILRQRVSRQCLCPRPRRGSLLPDLVRPNKSEKLIRMCTFQFELSMAKKCCELRYTRRCSKPLRLSRRRTPLMDCLPRHASTGTVMLRVQKK